MLLFSPYLKNADSVRMKLAKMRNVVYFLNSPISPYVRLGYIRWLEGQRRRVRGFGAVNENPHAAWKKESEQDESENVEKIKIVTGE